MADGPTEEPAGGASWQAGCIGCAGIVLAFVGLMFGVWAWEEHGIDPGRRCAPGETGDCISLGTGIVESSRGSLDRVTVSYEDGTKTTTVTMYDSGEPPPGARVRLEWWDGHIIALYDPKRERRYRTVEWPDPWWDWALFFAFCVVVVALILAAVFGIAALVARARAGYAASSNGKP